MSTFIGVDAGGSRTTAVVVDRDGTELVRGTSGPSGFQDRGPEVAAASIRALVAELIDASRDRPGASDERPARLVCAMAGGGRGGSASELEHLLGAADIADQVTVVTDADAALHAAFGEGPGIVVIGGTGSIAVGRARDGRTARAGGTLPPGGDPGSGEWLARQAIRARLDPVSQLGQRTLDASRSEVAGLARVVCEAASAGDQAAATLVRRAGEALADLVLDVRAGLAPWAASPRVALAGGLLEPERPVRDAVIAALRWESPPTEILPERVDGALGAARLAIRGGFVAGCEE